MIKTWYVADLKGESTYCSCNACGKPWQYDKKMVRVHFQNGYGFGVMVYLCDDCRRELHEKIWEVTT